MTTTMVSETLSKSGGGIAQLGERLNGIQEVSGSIPLTSTIFFKTSCSHVLPAFFFNPSFGGYRLNRPPIILMISDEQIDVIVPVFNEEEGLPEFISRLSALPLQIHPIFIDNASTDNSIQILNQIEGATVIRHATNEGYGASLRDGIRAATASKIVIIDADCEYPPEAIPELVKKLDNEEVVFASRFLLPEEQTPMPFLKAFGNKLISGLFNLLFKQQTTDLYTGSKAFRRSAVTDLPMERDGFEHVLEFAARLAKRGISIAEIHVTFQPRRTGTSKMMHLSETIKYLYFLIYYYLTIPQTSSESRA